MKKKMYAGILMMGILFAAVGCGSSKKDSTAPSEMTTESAQVAYDTAEMTADNGSQVVANDTRDEALTSSTSVDSGEVQSSTQKLIKNVYMTAETKEFDTLLNSLTQKIEELGGYVESSDVSGNSYSYDSMRYANLTIRIPAEKLNAFVTDVTNNENANVTSKTENVQDVTLQYVDLDSHIKALRAEQESLMKMLELAKKVDDIITIQSQLTNVRYEIESYESQLRTFDNQVNYSTVTLNINEVRRETPTETKTMGEKIKANFSKNLYEISEGGKNFVIWFVSSIPYLIIWAIALILVFLIGRRLQKRYRLGVKKEGKESHMQEKEKEDSHES
ncbi:MAG: hypothetical protein PWP24_1609 [Clostridiales bacterium]|nr:hypothetical protein [Clostridiales bacterium]